MSFDNRDHIDFGKADINSLFRSIFIPTLLGMLFSMTFLLADGIFVGHGIGPYGLAAINLIAPVMMLINGTGMMFGIGASVVGAFHMSQNNNKAARINVTQAYIAGIGTEILMAVILYCFPTPVMRLLGVSDQLMAMTREYYIWFIPTCLLLMVESIGLFVIRLDGSPKFAMMSNIVPAIVNIVLDFLFIIPCQMGLKGAALATDIGGAVGTLMVLYYMIFKAQTLNFYPLKHTLTSLRLSLRNIGYMLKVGFSGFISEVAVGVMMMVGNIMFGKYLGDDGIAAYSVACYLMPLVFMLCNAIAQSAQPIISFNHGAGYRQRVRKAFSHSLLIAIGAGIVITAGYAFLSSNIISAFILPGSEPFQIATSGLPVLAGCFVFMAINICTIGYLQSVGRAMAATILTLLRGVVFLVGAFVLMPHFFGSVGLWLAVPVAEIITFLFSAAIAYSVLWKQGAEQ